MTPMFWFEIIKWVGPCRNPSLWSR